MSKGFVPTRAVSFVTVPRLLPLAAAMLVAASVPAVAATIAVDDPSPFSLPGHCTLIDAVQALNTQAAVNNCMAGDGNNDTIDLTAITASTTIEYSQASEGYQHALVLTRAATLRGGLASDGTPLVTLTRSNVTGTPAFGLIDATAPLVLYGLGLTHGAAPYGGGGVSVGATLTLDHCVLSNNTAGGGGGAAAATGQLTVRHSVISGNSAVGAGGGLETNGTLGVYYSTISNNQTTDPNGLGGGGIYATGVSDVRGSVLSGNSSASKGGGIYVATNLLLVDSTISGNTAAVGQGGGVFALQYAGVMTSALYGNHANAGGGAVYSRDAEIENSTLTANSAGEGGAVQGDTVLLSYSTLSANSSSGGSGGGATFGTNGTANATIVFGNTPQDVSGPASASLTGQFNVIGSGSVPLPADTLNCDPQLGALADNGGLTHTMAPAPGSCAIDAASATPTASVDQRHEPRPALGTDRFRADIGAFERQAAESPDIVFASAFE